ncbi:hypothetical protein [Geminisphaera colitermitum]|uniref:hypothetical protein n=1 Tax=Geminisphaera colitermitum TaxID=1148786 RepID=UPI000158CC0A|nr:hypothetical protein [Geminisphaera colitermitum]
MKHLLLFLIAATANVSAPAAGRQLAIGYSNEGAIHIGEVTPGNDGLRIRDAEVLLEFYTKTDNWRFQRQTKNRSWVSRAAEVRQQGEDTFTIRGMVAGNEYEMSAAPAAASATAAVPSGVRLAWTTRGRKEKQDYRVLNETGFALVLEKNTPVSVSVDDKPLPLAERPDKTTTSLRKKRPGKVTITFPSGATFSLRDFSGISGWSLAHDTNGDIYIGFVRERINEGEGSFEVTLDPGKAVRLPPSAFQFAPSYEGWFPVRIPLGPAFDDVSSVLLDPPAGKYGFLSVKDEKFQFEKASLPIRFNGVQLVHGSKFPDKQKAQALADRIAAMGANIVRLHHIDNDASGLGLWKRSELPAKHQNFDDELIDRMDYLVSLLKKRGVYIHLDGITSVRFGPKDDIPNFSKLTYGLKGSAYVYENEILVSRQKQFFSKLWNHHNPYTGLAYKDDPVFVTTEIINESDLFTHGPKDHIPPPYRDTFQRMFHDWLDAQNQPRVSYLAAPRELTTPFNIHVMGNYYNLFREYLRTEGVRIPVSGTNWMHGRKGSLGIIAANAGMDYTALHPYGSGDSYRTAPHGPDGRSAILALGKVHGRPLVHNEWNMSNSSAITRSAGIIWQIALAAAAGHDASYLFALFHDAMRYDASHINSLNIGYDPAASALFPAASILFVRGDMRQPDFEFVYHPPAGILLNKINGTNFNDYLPDFSRAAFWAPTSIDYSPLPPPPPGRTPDGRRLIAGGSGEMRAMLPPASAYPAINYSGEVESWWRDGYFLIKTPRSKWAVGYLPGDRDLQLGDGVTLRLDEGQFACVTLTSLDGRPLAESASMRLATVSHVGQAGMYFDRKWRNPRKIDRDADLLCRPVTGEIHLSDTPTPLLLVPKNADTKPASAPAPVTRQKIRFDAPALVYEIIAATGDSAAN